MDQYQVKQEQCNTACADPYIGVSGQSAKAYYAEQCQTQAPGGSISQDYVIDQLFTYQPSNPYVAPKYETVREAAKYFAKVLVANVPQGADRTAAIRKLREAVMTANAGIALGGLSL